MESCFLMSRAMPPSSLLGLRVACLRLHVVCSCRALRYRQWPSSLQAVASSLQAVASLMLLLASVYIYFLLYIFPCAYIYIYSMEFYATFITIWHFGRAVARLTNVFGPCPSHGSTLSCRPVVSAAAYESNSDQKSNESPCTCVGIRLA
jgi:hypothetical protein